LIVWTVNETGIPLSVRLLSPPPGAVMGSMACSPFAPAAALTVNERTFPLQEIDPKDDPFRPSSHVSIC